MSTSENDADRLEPRPLFGGMGDGLILPFLTISSRICLSERTLRRITFEAKLWPRHGLTTSEGEKLTQKEWTIHVFDYEGGEATPGRGRAIYIPQVDAVDAWDDSLTSGCEAWFVLSTVRFESLLALSQSGRMIDLWLDGLSFGLDPDGREKVWDIKANKIISVTHADFVIPLAGASSNGEAEPETAPGREDRREGLSDQEMGLAQAIAKTHYEVVRAANRILIGIALLIVVILLKL